MSAALREHPVPIRAIGNGGVPGRRAVIRWAWRLLRREWRQQILLLSLLAVAVAATILGTAIAYNAQSTATAATFGTADEVLTVPGDSRHLAADIAAARRRFGAIDVIENQTIAVPGAVSSIELRAQDPHGRYGHPMLALVSGRYPAGPDEVAVTSGVASLFNVRPGDLWRQAGRARRVTGLVEDPANLLDQFALVTAGQVSRPTTVTVLFDAAANSVAGLHLPGDSTPGLRGPAGDGSKITPAAVVLAIAVFGLLLIGLVAVAGFAAMAQRRRRALGMLGALGATDRNVRLVMVTNGLVVGVIGMLIGAAGGFLAWIGYAPHLQRAVEHRVAWSNLPWWAIAVATTLPVVIATAASWRPARAAARVPIMTALSGRPASPQASHRSVVPGSVLFAGGLGCLTTRHNALLLVAGIVATTLGVLLLAPVLVAGPAAVLRRAPVPVRLAVRDLGRYRARSGPALAAIGFVVLLATLTGILATARSSSPLTFNGPNLAANQLILYEPHSPGSGYSGTGPPSTRDEQRALQADVRSLAKSVHARFVVALDAAGRPGETPCLSSPPECDGLSPPSAVFASNQRATLWQATSTGTLSRREASRKDGANYQGPLYVATPSLLRDYGIKPAQLSADTDIVTARRGLSAVPNLDLLGPGSVSQHYTADGHFVSERHQCAPGRCVARPKIQILTSLPSGTSAPNTLITEHAVHELHQQLVPVGWLIQTPGPLTPALENAARRLALAAETRIEISTGQPDFSVIRTGATVAGIVLALAVLASTVGLIRSETASDLRILTAAGASGAQRRALAGVTAGALGLLGALLGTAVAYLAIAAWAWGDSSLGTTLSPVPVVDLTVLLAGLPLAAAAGGWLLGGRQPPAISRKPLE